MRKTPSSLPPCGRLTLQSGYATQTQDNSNCSTVYYTVTGRHGNCVPIPDGRQFVDYPLPNGEISLTLNAAIMTAVGDAYSVFMIKHPATGAPTLVLEPSSWRLGQNNGNSITHYRSGAATTIVIDKTLGYWKNTNALAGAWNGGTNYGAVPAGNARFVGAVMCTAAGQTSMQLRPLAVVGGNNNKIGLYNVDNQTRLIAHSQDVGQLHGGAYCWYTETAGGTSEIDFFSHVAPVNSLEGPNGGLNNRINFIDALGTSTWRAEYRNFVTVGRDPNKEVASTVYLGLGGPEYGSGLIVYGGSGNGPEADQVAFSVYQLDAGALPTGGTPPSKTHWSIPTSSTMSDYNKLGVFFAQALEGGNNAAYSGLDFNSLTLDYIC